jgi:hypothetical protein
MSAILSFLGGSAFRAIWGEVSAWFTKRQEAKLEITRMKLQGELDGAAHVRRLESVRLEAELGVKTIRVQAEADAEAADAAIFREAMIASRQPTGIKWVDAWNGAMRPAFYTLAFTILLLICFNARWEVAALQAAGIIELMFSIIGFLFADRTMRKAGK